MDIDFLRMRLKIDYYFKLDSVIDILFVRDPDFISSDICCRCTKWVLACGMDEDSVPKILSRKNAVLCSNHFREEDYKNGRRK